MNIPFEVLNRAQSVERATNNRQRGYQVIAEWARNEALAPIEHYLNHCRILRTEPSSVGLSNALRETRDS